MRRYFDSSSNQEQLLNALRAKHTRFIQGKSDEIHPTCKSTHKRLEKINQMTWKIPSYEYTYFELGKNQIPFFVFLIAAEVIIG